MKKKFITILILCAVIVLFPITVNAEVKTFIKEYTYQASEFDSKATCRILALNQVKRLLLEELGTYLESITEVKNFQLTKDSIKSITAGIVGTEVLEEKWDGKEYWIKVEIDADPDEVAESIDNVLEKTALLNELLKEKQKTDEALKEISELKKKKKDSTQNKNNKKTQKDYENLVKSVGNFERWQKEFETISKGYIAHDTENFDDAIHYAKKILLNEDSKLKCEAFLLIGDSYRGQGMFHEALDVLSESLDLCSSRESLNRILLGRTYRDIKKYDRAISEFRKALSFLYNEKRRLSKQLPSPNLENDVEVLRKLRDWNDESIADIHSDISMAIIRRDLPTNFGDDPEQLIKFPEESLNELKGILKLKPNSIKHLRSWHKLGGGQFQEIIDWCNKLIKLRPNEDEIYFIRGSNYQRLEKYEQAIKDISEAIIINPDVADYYERRGFSYAMLGIYNEATKDYSKAIELNPTYAEAYFGRGMFGFGREKWRTIEDFKIAARLGHTGAKEFLRYEGIAW